MGSTDSFRPNSCILKCRDLITVGIFTALYFAVNFVCSSCRAFIPTCGCLCWAEKGCQFHG